MMCRTGQICIVQSPTMNFIFHNFKLELYSFCEPCPYSRMSFSSDKVTGTVSPHLKMPFLPNSEFI